MQQASVLIPHQLGLLPQSGVPPGVEVPHDEPLVAAQQSLPFGGDYEIGGRVRKTRLKRIVERVKQAFQQLGLPLFGGENPARAKPLRGDDAVVAAIGEEDEDLSVPKPDWTSDQVATLHGVLLEQSLSALKRRGNAAEKEDVLKWVFTPDVVWTRTEQNGVWKTGYIRTETIPFSFQFCCRLEKHDPEIYREAILTQLARVGIPLDRRLLAEYAMSAH